MSKWFLKFLFIFLSLNLVVFFFSPTETRAVSESSIYINTAPKNPGANESVTITLNSYAVDLDRISISWFVDGKNINYGIGKKSFSLNAPNIGQETKVTAKLSVSGSSIEKTIIIKPATLTLLWQAEDSYVPPFYKGKALPMANSKIRVVALPEIRLGSSLLNSKNLFYSWKKNYTNSVDDSGYGKNALIFWSDYLDDVNNISVSVSTMDQAYQIKTGVDIEVFEPKMLFYKNDPVLGTIWEKTIENGHTIAGDEIIEAIPYYISPKNIRFLSFAWDWFINGQPVVNFTDYQNLLPLRAEPGVSGTSKIKIQLNNVDRLYQALEKEISINF